MSHHGHVQVRVRLSQDIYTSSRRSAWGAWKVPVSVGDGVNIAAGESRPSLSWDGKRLYFGRSGEIYVSQRVWTSAP